MNGFSGHIGRFNPGQMPDFGNGQMPDEGKEDEFWIPDSSDKSAQPFGGQDFSQNP